MYLSSRDAAVAFIKKNGFDGTSIHRSLEEVPQPKNYDYGEKSNETSH